MNEKNNSEEFNNNESLTNKSNIDQTMDDNEKNNIKYIKSNQHKKTLKLVQLAFLSALIIVLQLLVTIMPLQIKPSLVMIPIVLGGCLYGVKEGTILGAVFGLITFIAGVTGIDPSVNAIFIIHPYITFIFMMLKATAAGFVSSFIYSKVKNNKKSVRLASICAPSVNTLIFIIGMATIYRDILQEMAVNSGFANVLIFVLIGFVCCNYIFEVLTTAIITPLIFPKVKNAISK